MGFLRPTSRILATIICHRPRLRALGFSPADRADFLISCPLFDAYTRQKELLQLALGLLGTVTGYYLGRIPAENAARRANQEATDAKQKRNDVAKSAQNLAEKAQALLVRDQQQPQSTRAEGELGGPDRSRQEELRAAIRDVQTELMK
jgi:hypothetical protein